MPVFAIYCGLNDFKYELFVNKSKKLKNLSVNFGIYMNTTKTPNIAFYIFLFGKLKKL